jgi:flagellar biosynthesis GTPase FlhF
MKIKSFYADSMDVALQSAGKEMGEDALILNTREAPAEFRHYGKYEVVCAVADNPDAQPALEAKPAPTTRILPAQASIQPARVMFLVGPSGAGKSSACSKIAIHSKFTLGLSPAVLSWDSGRVGGSDFVRSYCEIAGIPFAEVDSQEGFQAALKQFANADLILVDTAALEGNEVLSAETQHALEALARPEIHLVLSATYSTTYLTHCRKAYSRFRPEYLLPTHLDEARMDLAAPEMKDLSTLTIRWCGTGRAVPEDLQDAGKVVEQAAAMTAPPVAQEGFAVAALSIPSHNEKEKSAAVAANASARTAIEAILARFRRNESEPQARISGTPKSSAA